MEEQEQDASDEHERRTVDAKRSLAPLEDRGEQDDPRREYEGKPREPAVGVLLPCNVVVYEREGEAHISAVDPERMLSIVDNEQLVGVAAEVKERLGAVVSRAANG
jgi:Domain of unknown function DUF302